MWRPLQMRVIAVLLLSAILSGCSAAGIRTVDLRRPHHRIDTIAFVPGRMSESMAAAVDSKRFTVLGPEETDALMNSIGVTSWPVPPCERTCGLLASAGVDVVVSTRSVYVGGWCEWELYALVYSARTCGLVASIRWCAEHWGGDGAFSTARDASGSAEAVRIGRDLGDELNRRLRQMSDP